MDFKIKARYDNEDVLFWWDTNLKSDDDDALNYFKQAGKYHVSDIETDAGDVRNADINDPFEVYYGILPEFPNAKVVIEPDDEFFGYMDDVIY
ncbi:hypothetical protein [Weissella soli]|uniref:Uncharacterized protein n=1 Tax=Weissella soli TaxID=155866 RepID=A0A288QXP7_9LACO|nr:hypothetical protein [Weissella soli]AOT56601.1 hypothetical protein WSWS_00970 [Weissella soli]NKY83054.1 hypothetical protein [Weissella soli]RDL12165.1 hypothetical protein DFP99_0599 [Weissella soli]GEN92595.1 hypothetical protein WSO01_02070 [Weissella soli]